MKTIVQEICSTIVEIKVSPEPTYIEFSGYTKPGLVTISESALREYQSAKEELEHLKESELRLIPKKDYESLMAAKKTIAMLSKQQ